MKKIFALLLAVLMITSFVGCKKVDDNNDKTSSKVTDTTTAPNTDKPSDTTAENNDETEPAINDDPTVKSEGVMTHDEYAAAAVDSDVVIEGYVQAKQSWWNGKISLYLQDADGAYFVYNAVCTQEQNEMLKIGTKVKVAGKKAEWSGEIEIAEGATIEIEEGKYIVEAFDATSIIADNEELLKHQNEFAKFTGMTVAAKTDENGNELAFFYNWNNSGEDVTDADLYVDFEKDGATYSFTVEYYLCNEESDVYKAVQNLKVGDVVDVEGFLYWYNGMNTQITALTVAE